MRRTFLLSLILHGVLLTLLPSTLFQSRESASSVKEMQAMLVTAPPAAKSAQHPLPPTSASAVPPRPRMVRRESLHDTPALPPAVPAKEAVPQAETIAANAGTATPGASAAAPAVGQPRSEPPADGLREYRLALGREAGRFKREFDRKYDAIERERQRGWEGRVEMTVRTRAGLTPTVVLAHSSGFPPLDEQALELMGRAVRETVVPPALQGQAFALPVMLEFRIR